MIKPTALLISSDASLVDAVRGVIEPNGDLAVRVIPSLAEAPWHVEQDTSALVLVHLEQGNSVAPVISFLQMLAAGKRAVATVVLSDDYQAEQALDLLRAGAADYLGRPVDLSRLAYLVDSLTVRSRYLAKQAIVEPVAPSIESVGEHNPFFYVPDGQSGRLMEQLRLVAPQETTILLTGETGTGKTRLASLIHELSPRREESLLVVNCGALSSTLIESEIFGHVKGAFTGADRDRSGKFAEAGCGTLLLDEIDALSLTSQSKLLRAVEERVFEPVGANHSMPVRARLIAASNRNLEKEVAAGRFRADLYYRLNVVGFHMPPLREQRGLIAHLARRFVAEFAARNRRPVHGIARDALQKLMDYDWPGNVRQLRNVIERAVTLCPRSEIQFADLADGIAVSSARASHWPEMEWQGASETPAPTLAQTKEEAEATRIAAALKRNRNNRLRAAAELGISRMTLYNKLHKYGLFGTT